MTSPLPREFYLKDTSFIAKKLLGKILVRETPQGVISGKIVETEAYYGLGDPASHAFRGPTPRSKIMWAKGGTAYVYFTYGKHFLFNPVTEKRGKPGAVLIRALEPLTGINLMKKNRQKNSLKNLTNGPAKLTQPLVITKKDNSLDLTSPQSKLYLVHGEKILNSKIISTTRIGIRVGTTSNLRFYIKGNEFVSRNDHFHVAGFLIKRP